MMYDGSDSRSDLPDQRQAATTRGNSANPDTAAPREQVNEWLDLGHSGIHGRGGFARCLIPAGTSIIEYVGDRVDKAESTRRCEDGNPFIFTINPEWDIDGNVDRNPARFLNHSCAPNCEAQQEEDRIWIVAIRDIEPGEELTFNYGYDLSEWRDYPCECGAASCLGFIVAAEHHIQVRRQLKEEFEATSPDRTNSNHPNEGLPESKPPAR